MRLSCPVDLLQTLMRTSNILRAIHILNFDICLRHVAPIQPTGVNARAAWDQESSITNRSTEPITYTNLRPINVLRSAMITDNEISGLLMMNVSGRARVLTSSPKRQKKMDWSDKTPEQLLYSKYSLGRWNKKVHSNGNSKQVHSFIREVLDRKAN